MMSFTSFRDYCFRNVHIPFIYDAVEINAAIWHCRSYFRRRMHSANIINALGEINSHFLMLSRYAVRFTKTISFLDKQFIAERVINVSWITNELGS